VGTALLIVVIIVLSVQNKGIHQGPRDGGKKRQNTFSSLREKEFCYKYKAYSKELKDVSAIRRYLIRYLQGLFGTRVKLYKVDSGVRSRSFRNGL